MRGRTVILVSHHVQLCAPGAAYIVALDNGRVSYSGDTESFKASGAMAGLVQSDQKSGADNQDAEEEKVIEDFSSNSSSSSIGSPSDETAPVSEASSTIAAPSEADTKTNEKKSPRKLIEEEKRAVGRIGMEIWKSYFSAVGGTGYWVIFIAAVSLAALSPVAENGWLRLFSRSN